MRRNLNALSLAIVAVILFGVAVLAVEGLGRQPLHMEARYAQDMD